MVRLRHAIAAGSILVVALGTGSVARLAAQDAPAEGRRLYMDYCSSCHGGGLEGQPDWMSRLPSGRLPAPPHDASGHTWHHSDRQLLTIVRDGLQAIAPGYQSDMPAFAETLTKDQITSVLDFIKSSWPERERLYQQERSRLDPSG